MKSSRGFRLDCINDAVWDLKKKKSDLWVVRWIPSSKLLVKFFFPHVLILVYFPKKDWKQLEVYGVWQTV